MKRHSVIMAACAIAFVGSTMSASAATLNQDPNASVYVFKLGGMPGIRIPRNGTGTATISHAPLVLTTEESIWSTISGGPGTSLFTGVPFLSHLTVTAKNYAMTASDNATAVPNPVGDGTIDQVIGFGGGPAQFKLVFLAGEKAATVNLSKAGQFSKATTAVSLGDDATPPNVFAKITVTMGPWFTQTLNITGVTTALVQMPARAMGEQTGATFTLDPTAQEEVRTFTTMGGFITTGMGVPLKLTSVTVMGSNNFPTSATGGTGTITLVTPMRIKTGAALVNTFPGVIRQKFSFVPEPGTLVLLASGVLGLLVVGVTRSKR